jgi:hypothetical protein
MKPSLTMALGIAICVGACAKGTIGSLGQASPDMGWAPWVKKEDSLVSALKNKQDANLVRLAQQRALEQAIEEQALRDQAVREQALRERSSRSRKGRVPPSMYRTTEPPLPEPDLSLPVQDIPRSVPEAKPSPRKK